MKKIFLVLLALVFLSADAQQLEKSLLWKISGKGLTTPSYLYGTIHATCDTILDKNVTMAIKATQQLYLELDMDDPDMPAAMMKDMNMKGGKTLDQLASKDDYAVLETFLNDNMSVPIKMINSLKPFFISAMFLPKMLDCEMKSVEEQLMKIGKSQHDEVFGLETIQEQMAIFDAIPYQDQMDELIKSVKDNLVSDKKEFREMLKIYKEKDITNLLKATENTDNTMYSKYENELLNNRNRNWIPKIEQVIQSKPTFFGFGAAHLGGENGVIQLLREQGYKVEAVL